MYTHNNNTAFSRAADSPGHFLHSAATADPQFHRHQLGELDSAQHESVWQLNSEVMNNNNNYYYCSSSGCSSYMGSPSSLASCETQRTTTTLMQRSISSHSLLHKNNNNNININNSNNINNNNGSHQKNPISALFAELLQSDNGPVRRVYSTGDLQRINGMQHYHHQLDSPLSSESSMIIEAMSRASPYSPEEKKVRIQRYRSKRNQRNFTKKIKYACRKTLADSRPRIRGRFARNDEIVMMMNNNSSSEVVDQWNQFGAVAGDELEEYDEDDENWANFFDSLDPAVEPQDSTSSFGYY